MDRVVVAQFDLLEQTKRRTLTCIRIYRLHACKYKATIKGSVTRHG